MKYCDSCHSTYPTEFTVCPKDQHALRVAAELAEGMVLRGKYEVLEKIGTGGMATVYRVRHLHLQEEVALKLVSSRLVEDQDFVERFKTEAVITRKLRHPNAVRLDDFDLTDDGRPFIVMELVRGKSLRQFLQEGGWLSPERAADIARQAARGLGAAHQLGIVHRDVKPENLLLIAQPDGSYLVKVVDFGIAKLSEDPSQPAGAHATKTGIVLGTPRYLSPEQARGKRGAEVDGRADLYALGVVLYEMLTGRVPFDAETPFDLLLHHIGTVATPPREACPALGISQAMSDLVMKALDKDPARRFQSGEEMAAALEQPPVRVQEEPQAAAQGSAQIFGTAALAAAAVAGARPKVQTVATRRTDTVRVPANVMPSPSTRTVKTGTATAKNEPVFEKTLPMGSEYETAKRPRPGGWRSRKWAFAAAGSVAAAVVLWAGVSFTQSDSSVEAKYAPASAPAAVERTNTGSSRASSNRRQPSVPSAAPKRSAEPGSQARAQALVAQGYRRMEKQDFRGAEEAFSQALELDPENTAAQRGLQAARTGQTVKGIAGVFGR
ncbi:MAG: protein kinase domain-containing protein [Terriglobales bacterium]